MYLPIQSRRQLRRRGVGDINTVASAIQTQEGWFPGSVSYRNNNPGNLMYAGQPGSIGADPNGFAIFPDFQTGWQALLNQISLDASRGLSIFQFTSKYAPAAAGNDPTAYANSLAAATGVSPSDSLAAALAGSPSSSGGLLDTSGLDLSSILPSDPMSWLVWGSVGALVLVLMSQN